MSQNKGKTVMPQELCEALKAANIDPIVFGNDAEAARATLRQINMGKMTKNIREPH